MSARPFCYTCHRPQEMCLCDRVVPVNNRTGVVVLQHIRERFHPFGSVRLLQMGLRRCEVHVAYRATDKVVHHPVDVPPGTVLLYPRPGARRLDELAPSERPEHLLLLDGTWSQAHRLYRDNAWLRRLPHVVLAPTTPSLYRVRREPKPHCLSTLEAAVQALEIIEPECDGLSGLLGVFAEMNERQVARRGLQPRQPRRARRSRRASRAVPAALSGALERIVVVYGESALLHTRASPEDLEPIQWTAVRLGEGRCFERFAWPALGQPDVDHLRCMALTEAAFAGASDLAALRQAWCSFLDPGDVVVAWNSSTLRMHELLLPGRPSVLLKQAYTNVRQRRPGTLEAALQREGIPVVQLPVTGRARVRLANAQAMALWLREQGLARHAPSLG